jgi:hypothetical protein
MNELAIPFLLGLGLSLLLGSSILIIKRKDKFSLLVGIFTLKPVLAAISIFGLAFLFQKLDLFLPYGYTLIICFILDFVICIILLVAFRDIALESWFAVLIYLIDTFRWLGWLYFMASVTDNIGIIEIFETSLHGFAAIVNMGILFLKSRQAKQLEKELIQIY